MISYSGSKLTHNSILSLSKEFLVSEQSTLRKVTDSFSSGALRRTSLKEASMKAEKAESKDLEDLAQQLKEDYDYDE